MGNLCGKESPPSDPFSQPGRTVASTSSTTATQPSSSNPRAPIPTKITSPGRTLGGGGPSAQQSGGAEDARGAAARAAEERAVRANTSKKGKLGRDLARERAQTRTGVLGGVSVEERRRREVDEGVEVRNWN